MSAPWTRDGTVRAYAVTLAPEVAGRIVELPVIDNEYVHKGDLLMVIDPTNYTIAVSQAEAAVQQGEASVQNIDAQIAVQQAQISANGHRLIGRRQRSSSRSSRRAATGKGRRTAGVPFRMPEQYASQLQQQEAAARTARKAWLSCSDKSRR